MFVRADSETENKNHQNLVDKIHFPILSLYTS